MKKTKIFVSTLALYFSFCSIPAHAILPANSIIIENQAYSSEYVAEHTQEINTKMGNKRNGIYIVNESSNIFDYFRPTTAISESDIAKKSNMLITYYTKNKIQSYTTSDINTPFQLQNEYSSDSICAEVVATVSSVGAYKTINIKVQNIINLPNGKFFKLQDKTEIKSANGIDTISILTNKDKEKIYIIGADRKTLLAEATLDFSNIKTGGMLIKLDTLQGPSLNLRNATITNNPGRSDVVEISGLQPKSTIKVYDGKDTTKLLGKAVAYTNGIATIRGLSLDPHGGSVKISLTEDTSVEGPLMDRSYSAECVPQLYLKPSFVSLPGFENNGRTQIKLGVTSIRGNSYRYKLSDSSIETPTVNDVANDWIPVSNGDIISNALNKYINVAEVDSNSNIIRFSEMQGKVTNELIGKLKNGLKFSDVPGMDNNNKTEIILGSPSVSGNRFVYKISSNNDPVSSPKYGEVLDTKNEWKLVKSGDAISAANGKHIGVAEIDSNNKAVQFSDGTAVVSDDGLPSLVHGLKFVDAPGEKNNGKTQIILGSPSVPGNTFKYKISDSSAPVSKPDCKENIGAENLGWKTIYPDEYITVTNGKHIGVAEVNSNNEVIQFSDSVAVVIDENSSAPLENLSLDYVLDKEGNRKVKMNLPKPSFPANKFKYIISSDEKPVPAPNVGTSVSSWTSVVDGDLISVEYGKNIGIAEVDSDMKLLKFTNCVAKVDSNKLVDTLNSVSFTDVLGHENNGKTKVSLPNASSPENSFKYFISSNTSEVPAPLKDENLSSWKEIYNGMVISTENGKNIGIAEVKPDGKAVRFINTSAVVVNENGGLIGGVLFKPAENWKGNGKTRIVLGQPSAQGNKFKYTISNSDKPVTMPEVNSSISSWTYVQDGDLIAVENGKHIGVAEVNANDKVVAFSDEVAVVVDYASPLVNGLSLVDMPGLVNNGKATVKLGTPSNVKNKYMYKIFDDLQNINYKTSDSPNGFIEMPSDNILSIKNGKYLGVAEVNNNLIVKFSVVQMNIPDEKIEATVTDGQSKMYSGNLSVDPYDSFTLKVIKGTLKTGALENGKDFNVTGLPSGITMYGNVSSDNTITFTLRGSVSSALTSDVDIKVTLNYSSIIDTGVDSTVNSGPISLTIKKY